MIIFSARSIDNLYKLLSFQFHLLHVEKLIIKECLVCSEN
jgi:hypothetical protein